MRFEPQNVRPLTLPKTTPTTPSGPLAVLRFRGRGDEKGEEWREAPSSPALRRPPPPAPAAPELNFINIHFPKCPSLLGPPWKRDYFRSLHWPCCPRLHPSRNSCLRETGQSLERTVPGDELSVGRERRGNRAAEHSPQAQLDLGITAESVPGYAISTRLN